MTIWMGIDPAWEEPKSKERQNKSTQQFFDEEEVLYVEVF